MNLKLSTLYLVVSTFTLFVTRTTHAQVAPSAITQQQAVAYAHSAEANPLGLEADQQRKAAFNYAENDHSSHIVFCKPLFNQIVSDKSSHGNDIRFQMMISAAAFLYEHPEAADDFRTVNVAGLDAALNVYEKFLAADPTTKSAVYDKLLKKRSEGKLEKVVAGMCPR